MLKLVAVSLAGFATTVALEGEDLNPNLNRPHDRDAQQEELDEINSGDIGQAWFKMWQSHEVARKEGFCPERDPLDLCIKLCGSQARIAAKDNQMVDYGLCRVLCMNEDKCEQYAGCPDCNKVKSTWKLACGTGTLWHHGQKECVGYFQPGEKGPSFCGKNTEWDERSMKCVGVSKQGKGKGKDAGELTCGQAKSKVKRGYVALTTHVKTSCDCMEYCMTVSKGEFHRAWSFEEQWLGEIQKNANWAKAEGKAKSKKGKCSCYTGGDRARIAIVPGKDFAGMLEYDS